MTPEVLVFAAQLLASPAPLALVEAPGLRVLGLTPALLKRLRLDAAEAEGRALPELAAPGHEAALRRALLDLIQHGRAPHGTVTLRTGDGGSCALHLHGTRLTLPGGAPAVLLTLTPAQSPAEPPPAEPSTPLRHEQLLEHVLASSTDPVVVLDASPGPGRFRVLYANPAMTSLEELPGAALPGSLPTEWGWGRRDAGAVRAVLAALAEGREPPGELHLPDLGAWWELRVSELRGPGGQTRAWALHLHGITRRKAHEQFRRARAEAARQALRGLALGTVLERVLSALERLLPGWTALVVRPAGAGLAVDGRLAPELRAWFQRSAPERLARVWAVRDPQRVGTAQVLHDVWNMPGAPDRARELEPLGVQTSVEVPLYNARRDLLGVLALVHPESPQVPPDLGHLLGDTAADIALLIEREDRRAALEALAYTDSLTGLLSRAGFERVATNALARAGRRGGRVALALMDLNRFKDVNDGLGHAAGDELLRQLAGRLRRLEERFPVHALARMGGDEFALLIGGEADLEAVGAAIEASVSEPVTVAGRVVWVGASVGWSLFPQMGADLGHLLRQADTAMYVAKRSGLGAQLYAPSQQPPVPALLLEHALHEALGGDQLRMVYQPRVRCGDGALIGAEALVRWQHPRLGEVPPDDFIPVAEASGMIHALGAWVMLRACQEFAAWGRPDLKLSVNVSAMQLRHEAFAEVIGRALDGSGLAPSQLVLEVTESALLTDPGRVREILSAVRARGIQVSVDDFGTGYSTLMTLRNLLADELKIDRDFMQDIDQATPAGRENCAIVKSAIALARSLGVNVTAEGVETPGQAEVLRRLGCDAMQGWLIAPGLSAAEFQARYGAPSLSS